MRIIIACFYAIRDLLIQELLININAHHCKILPALRQLLLAGHRARPIETQRAAFEAPAESEVQGSALAADRQVPARRLHGTSLLEDPHRGGVLAQFLRAHGVHDPVPNGHRDQEAPQRELLQQTQDSAAHRGGD